jgi:hypothetical protein
VDGFKDIFLRVKPLFVKFSDIFHNLGLGKCVLNSGHFTTIILPLLGYGVSIPSTQRHYRRLILLLNTTYTATCFGITTDLLRVE